MGRYTQTALGTRRVSFLRVSFIYFRNLGLSGLIGACLVGTVGIPAIASANFALHYDGVDDYTRVLDIGHFDFDTTFTIEAWVKADSITGPDVFKGVVSGRGSDQPNSSGGWILFLSRSDHSQWGISVCTPNCSSARVPTGSLTVGEWHHLAATYDGAAIKVYHDGELKDTVAHSGNVTDSSHLFIGAWGSTFDGLIDEVRVWNVARTQQDIIATITTPLQGNEAGLVAYWPFDDGSGQFATDLTNNGQSARLGSADAADAQDPLWVESDSPLIPPYFQLTPLWGGLGTEIGISSVLNPLFNCGWAAGETIEIWWDKPEAQLATFVVDDKGCFEGLFRLDDDERITGSEPGTHEIQARASITGTLTSPFEQTESQLHLNPAEGPSERSVSITGCGWDGANVVTVLLQPNNDVLANTAVNPATGCIDDTMIIPRKKDGFLELLAIDDSGTLFSGATYWVRSPYIRLTPQDGPPGARVPLVGCNWFPQEQIDFAFTDDNVTFDNAGTGDNGCITTGGPTEPVLIIPTDAALGTRTIRATGVTSGQVVTVPYHVRERTLIFDPDFGVPGDPVVTSGCGWVGNNQVTVEWGYPDTNNLPIRWSDNVDPTTGCFGLAGDFIIEVPANTINGELIQTATGDVSGETTAPFQVGHEGTISIPSPTGVAGGPLTVDIFDAIVGETITFRWDVGHAFDGVGAAVPDFSYEVTLPIYASVGLHTITADGTKGFDDQASVTILDNAEITVTTSGDIVAGDSIDVSGSNWAAGEFVRFEIRKDSDTWPIAEKFTVASDRMDFSGSITLPADLSTGLYALVALGNKGRDAETELTVQAAAQPAFQLTAEFADPPPNLDGELFFGEWNYTNTASFGNGFIAARSDETRLYLLLDLTADTGADAIGSDNFWLTFDIWKNGLIDNGFDLNFRLDAGGDMVLEEYTGPDSFSPRNSVNLRSAYGAGFGCFFSDGSLSFTVVGFIPRFNCNEHRVWEIAVDLATIGAIPGGEVRLGIRTISPSPTINEELPAGFSSDFSELGIVSLAPSRLDPNPPAGAVTGIGSDGFEIEVTQAIQDADNSLNLVANKSTVARVYPMVAAEALVRTFLFGRRNGEDLPGSPLVTLTTVPEVIDRRELTHTANFLLPESWTSAGIIELTGIVENLDGSNVWADQTHVDFHERRHPEIWVYPFNLGDATTPILPSHADMLEQELVLERMIPTPSVKYFRRPWTEPGYTLNTVSCQDVSAVGNNDGNLDPAESLTCSHSYTITEADVKRESFPRWAVAAGDGGGVRSGTQGLRVELDAPAAAAARGTSNDPERSPEPNEVMSAIGRPLTGHGAELTLAISSDFSTFKKSGDVIKYTYTVTSSGTAPVPGPIVVGDSKIGIGFSRMKKELNDMWNTVYMAKAQTNDTDSMPELLYGHKVLRDPGAVGTSDPVYSDGRGRVVVGQADGSDFNSTTMLHEANHNLDRSSSGTWGRHVADPKDVKSKTWGCGAGGPDPAWPYDGTDNIQEVGFDTTLPWTHGAGEHLTVVPNTRDDFMSYCWKKGTPIQWISPYRWRAMFANFAPVPAAAVDRAAVLDNVFYVSGQLTVDGNGSLEPVLLQPGSVETAALPGDYTIELEDAGNAVLYSMPFSASFMDPEGVEQDNVFFSFRLPYFDNVAEVLLKYQGATLFSIEASANPPTIEVISPSDGDNWNGVETIQWTAADADGDDLVFTVLYSPDDGANWHAVASGLTGFEYTLDVSRLPGGTGGRVMLIASDGFHTVQAQSAGTFSVPYPSPTVLIETPDEGETFELGEWIDLRGTASDLNGTAPGEFTYAWSINGEFTATGSETQLLLGEGEYTVRLVAYDALENYGEDTIVIKATANQAPNVPGNPSPADGAMDVAAGASLAWSGGDPDGDLVFFDVYLDAGLEEFETPTTRVCQNIAVANCDPPGDLLPATSYSWRVVARDEPGESSESVTWQFSTGAGNPTPLIFRDGFE